LTSKPSFPWKRFLTASILIPFIFIYLYWGGSRLFFLLVWGGFLLGAWEYLRLTRPRPYAGFLFLHWLAGTLILSGAFWQGLEGFLAALVIAIILFVIQAAFIFPPGLPFFEFLGKQFLGIWYLPFFLSFIILIRSQDQGLIWIFFLLAVTYAGDSAAFFVGRTWGRHKLVPQISPHKTLEGALGGLAANGVTAWIFQQTLFAHFSLFQLLSLALFLGAASQLGDLFESMIKRSVRAKDSGAIFPGHGGFLDRVDSLLLPLPLLYFYIRFAVHPF